MPAAHRKGDIGSGHACHFPPTPATDGSPDVFVNGRSVMREGDSFAAHACVSGHAPAHGRALAAGSPTVFINGKPAGRKGDSISCGGTAQTGSGDVFIDDNGPGKLAGGSAAAAAAPAPAQGAGGTACQVQQASQSSPMVRG
ncbi:uropathogenic specific protein [Paracoccus sp. M683]|nr:uropathogenic specific protein [Paracoccus sp. M683]